MIRRHPLIGSAGSKYGLVYTDNNAVFLERQTANGVITDSKKLKIKIKELKGKSQVWNQLVQNGDFADGITGWSVSRGTASAESETMTLTANGTGTAALYKPVTNLVAGHTYLYRARVRKHGGAYVLLTPNATRTDIVAQGCFTDDVWTDIYRLFTLTATFGSQNQVSFNSPSENDYVEIQNFIAIDLTLLGIDNLTTVEEVEAWLANNIGDFPYYAFNPGTILNSKFNIFESVEFNQWDEEWELGIWNSSGEKQNVSSAIRSKNKLSCLPNTTYYCKCGAEFSSGIVFRYFDADGKYISSATVKNNMITTPDNVHLFAICSFSNNNVTTYNHDICINLSNPIHNGQYKPYKSHTINLNLTTITGKINGEGESVVICPDGLKSAGSAYDEGVIENGYLTKIIKRIGVVDMGNLNWVLISDETYLNRFKAIYSDATVSGNSIVAGYNNVGIGGYGAVINADLSYSHQSNSAQFNFHDSRYSTAEAFAIAVTGQKLNYERVTPLTYILDIPIKVSTFGHSYGVERILPQNTEEPYTTPANMVIDYLAKN